MPPELIDWLFLAWDCPHCTRIKAQFSGVMMDEDLPLSPCGHRLAVVHTFTNAATRALLDRFGLEGLFTPVLSVAGGPNIVDDAVILSYLRTNYPSTPV